MQRKHVAVAALVVVVALAGVAGALVTGFGPALGGDDGAGASTPYEDTVVVDDSTDAGGGGGDGGDTGGDGGSGDAESQPPFSFVIQNIEKCGQRCRNVTATITNNQNTTATGVTVRSEIYTGENYDNKVWEGTSDAGDLAPGEAFTDHKVVELGYAGAYAVQQNDGEILIKTYVITDDQTFVFKERRDVI